MTWTFVQKEEDGVMTIKFKDPISAQACVMKMNGRYFDGRQVGTSSYPACPREKGSDAIHQIYAGIYTGKERYHKSGAGLNVEDEEQEEKVRLENFAHWLVDGDEVES